MTLLRAFIEDTEVSKCQCIQEVNGSDEYHGSNNPECEWNLAEDHPFIGFLPQIDVSEVNFILLSSFGSLLILIFFIYIRIIYSIFFGLC